MSTLVDPKIDGFCANAKLLTFHFLLDGIIIWTFATQGNYKLGDQPVLLTILTYQN